MKNKTREVFLAEAVEALRPLFKRAGFPLPKEVRVTCGWPSSGALARKKRSLGECWQKASSADKLNEVFISPAMDRWIYADRAKQAVGDVLVHELAHVVDDCQHGHKKEFVKIARAVGLEGKPTSTHAGPELYEYLQGMKEKLGDYPHGKLDARKGKATQTTRLIKCECGACGYTARVTRKWLQEVGAPLCPCNQEEMEFEIPVELANE